MSCEDIRATEWRENRGCDFSETFSKSSEEESFIHQINKDWSLFHVWAMRPSLFFEKLQGIRQPPRSMRQRRGGRLRMWLRNEASCERLKSWNEAQGDDKWGSKADECLPCMTRMQTCLMCWSLGSLPWKEKDDLIDFTTMTTKPMWGRRCEGAAIERK